MLCRTVFDSFVLLTGAAWRSGGEQSAVQSDAGGGALAAGGGLQRSGCGHRSAGGTLESPAEEAGAQTHQRRQEVEAEEQVSHENHIKLLVQTADVSTSLNVENIFEMLRFSLLDT